MKISYMLLVTFSHAIFYGFNHIYLQNAMISGRLTPSMACPQDVDEGKVFSVEGSYEYIEKAAQTADMWRASSLGVGRGANNSSL